MTHVATDCVQSAAAFDTAYGLLTSSAEVQQSSLDSKCCICVLIPTACCRGCMVHRIQGQHRYPLALSTLIAYAYVLLRQAATYAGHVECSSRSWLHCCTATSTAIDISMDFCMHDVFDIQKREIHGHIKTCD